MGLHDIINKLIARLTVSDYTDEPYTTIGSPQYSRGTLPKHVADQLPETDYETMNLGGVNDVIAAVDKKGYIIATFLPNGSTVYNQESVARAAILYNQNIKKSEEKMDRTK